MISYASKIYETNPYILPVDLGLLARVNAYKQEKFYENADKVGGMLSALQNTDIANSAQAEKLRIKAANLTNQLNEAGGIDYSDRSLTNQIMNYGSEIYSDPDIERGIISTKKIRKFQQNVEKLQTDPKLSKYYNVSNITRTMEQQIKPYVNGDISASYDGPTAPRPYEGNPFEKLLKNMKNLPPDVAVRIGDSGTPSLYKISTNEELSAMDIDATFDGLIDANTKAQLMDDAWYNFDYGTGYKFDKIMGQQIYNNDLTVKSRNLQSAIDAIDVELKSTTDPTIIASKKDLKQKNLSALEYIKGEIAKGDNEFGAMWDKDPDNAKYALYVGKMRGDIIKAAGYSKEKVDFKTNQEWLANKRMELEAYKQGYQLNTDGTYSKLPWADDGKTRGADGKLRDKNGKIIEEEPLTTSLTNLDASNRTEAENRALMIDETAVNNQIDQYKDINNELWRNIFHNIVQENGLEETMGYKLNPNSIRQGVAQTLSSDFVANIAGKDNRLTMQEIEEVVQSADKYLNGTTPKNINLTKEGKRFPITNDQLKVLRTLTTGMHAVAQGKVDEIPAELKSLTKEFVTFSEQLRLNEINIQNRKDYLKNVATEAINNSDLKLSPKDKAALIAFESGERPKAIGKALATTPTSGLLMGTGQTKEVNVYDPEYIRLKDKIDYSKVEKAKEKAFKAASQTYNYYSAILSNNKDNDDMLKRYILKEGAEGTKINIRPLAVRQSDNGQGWQIEYAYGPENKEALNAKIELTNQQAQQIGVQTFAHPEIEDAFRYGNTVIDNLLTYTHISDGTTDKVMPISYKIMKRGQGNFVPAIVYNGKNYLIKSSTPLNSGNSAYEVMQTIASQRYKSIQGLIEAIEKTNSNL